MTAESPAERPVILLAGARSGSTLLRIILDTHPDLACPETTNVVEICARLSRQWRQLDASGSQLSPAAAATIRSTVDAMFAGYLAGHGKSRWCDRSLGSDRWARDFRRVYPDAVFICLYRHCLDMVDSGIEASRWGANSYEFTRYLARHPGNTLAALTEYWVNTTGRILAFENTHANRSTRVYYEDLVTSPEETIASVLEFLGERPAPGITEACFDQEHGTRGDGDYKIWATRQVSDASVGRGSRVPWERIPTALRRSADRILAQLGYPPLGQPYTHVGRLATELEDAPTPAEDLALATASLALDAGLRERASQLGSAPDEWLKSVQGKPIKISVFPHRGREDPRHWLIDLAPANVTRCVIEPEVGFAWTLRADAAALLSVIAGDLNLGTALRDRHMQVVLPPAAGHGQGSVSRPATSPAERYVRNRILLHLLVPGSTPTVNSEKGALSDGDY